MGRGAGGSRRSRRTERRSASGGVKEAAAFPSSAKLWGRFRGFGPATLDPLGPRPERTPRERELAGVRAVDGVGFAPCAFKFDTLLNWCRKHLRGQTTPKMQAELLATGMSLANEAAVDFRHGDVAWAAAPGATAATRSAPPLSVDGPYYAAAVAGLAVLSAFAAGTQSGWVRRPDGEPYALDQALALLRECGPHVAALATLVPLQRHDGVRIGGEPAAAADRSRGSPVARCVGPKRVGGADSDLVSAADALLATEAIVGAQLLAGPVPVSVPRSPPELQPPSNTSRLWDPEGDWIEEKGAAPIGDENPSLAALTYPHRRLLLHLFADGARAPVLDADGVARPLRRTGRSPPSVAVSRARRKGTKVVELSLPPGLALSAAELQRTAAAAWARIKGEDAPILARWTAARAALEEAAAHWRAHGEAARPPGVPAGWDVAPGAGPVTRVAMLAPESPAEEGDPCAPPHVARAIALAAARRAVCLSPGTLALVTETLEQLQPQDSSAEGCLGVAEPGPLWDHLPPGSIPRAVLVARALLVADGTAAAAAVRDHAGHPLAADLRAAATALAHAILGDTSHTPPCGVVSVVPTLHGDAVREAGSSPVAALRAAARQVRDTADGPPAAFAEAVGAFGAALCAVDHVVTLAAAPPLEDGAEAVGHEAGAVDLLARPSSRPQSDAEPSSDGGPAGPSIPPTFPAAGGGGAAAASEEPRPNSPEGRLYPALGPAAAGTPASSPLVKGDSAGDESPVVSPTTVDGPGVAAGHCAPLTAAATAAAAAAAASALPPQSEPAPRAAANDVWLVTAACASPAAQAGDGAGKAGSSMEEEEEDGDEDAEEADPFSPFAHATLRKWGLDPTPQPASALQGKGGAGSEEPAIEPCPPPVTGCAFGPMPSHQHASLILRTCGGDLSRARLRDVLAIALRGSTCAANQAPGSSSIPMIQCTRCGVWDHDACESQRRALYHCLRAPAARLRGADGAPPAFSLQPPGAGPRPMVQDTMAYAASVIASVPVVEEALAPMPDVTELAGQETGDQKPAFRAQTAFLAEHGATPAGSRRLYRALAARWREASGDAVALGLREGSRACARLRASTSEAIFLRFADDSEQARQATTHVPPSAAFQVSMRGDSTAHSVAALSLHPDSWQGQPPGALSGAGPGAGEASHPHVCALCLWELDDWRERGRPGTAAPAPSGTGHKALHVPRRWSTGDEGPSADEQELVAREMFVQERQRRCGCGVRRSRHLKCWAKCDPRQREAWLQDARREWYRLRLLDDREALLRAGFTHSGMPDRGDEEGEGEGAVEAPAETLLSSASLLPPLLGAPVPVVGTDASVTWHAAAGRDRVARSERTCAHDGCAARAKLASQYCSHACGVAAAEAALRTSLATAVQAGSAWSVLQREAAAVAGRLSAATDRRNRLLEWQIKCIHAADNERGAHRNGPAAAAPSDGALLDEERAVMAPLLEDVGACRQRREELERECDGAVRQRSWLRAAVQAVRALRRLERCLWLSDVGRGVVSLAVVSCGEEEALQSVLRNMAASTARGRVWVREVDGSGHGNGAYPRALPGGKAASAPNGGTAAGRASLSCPLCMTHTAPGELAHHMATCARSQAELQPSVGAEQGVAEKGAVGTACGFFRDSARVKDAARRVADGGADLVLALCRLSVLFNSTKGNALAGVLKQLQPVARARLRRLVYCARVTVSGSIELAFAKYLTSLPAAEARVAVARPLPASGWPPAGRETQDWGLSVRWLRAMVRLGEALKAGDSEAVRENDASVGARAAAVVHSDAVSRIGYGEYSASSRTTPWTERAWGWLAQSREELEKEASVATCRAESAAAVAAAKAEDASDLNLRSDVKVSDASVVEDTMGILREAGTAAATLIQGLSDLCQHTCGEPGAACRRHVAWECVQDVAFASSATRARDQRNRVLVHGRNLLGLALPLREWQGPDARRPAWCYVPVPVPAEGEDGDGEGPNGGPDDSGGAAPAASPRLWRGGDHVLAVGSVSNGAAAAAAAIAPEASDGDPSPNLLALAKRRRLRGRRSAAAGAAAPLADHRPRGYDPEGSSRKRPRQALPHPHPAALRAPSQEELRIRDTTERAIAVSEGMRRRGGGAASAGTSSSTNGAGHPTFPSRVRTIRPAPGPDSRAYARHADASEGLAPPLHAPRPAAATTGQPSEGARGGRPPYHGTVTPMSGSTRDSVTSSSGRGGRVYFGRRSHARHGVQQ